MWVLHRPIEIDTDCFTWLMDMYFKHDMQTRGNLQGHEVLLFGGHNACLNPSVHEYGGSTLTTPLELSQKKERRRASFPEKER